MKHIIKKIIIWTLISSLICCLFSSCSVLRSRNKDKNSDASTEDAAEQTEDASGQEETTEPTTLEEEATTQEEQTSAEETSSAETTESQIDMAGMTTVDLSVELPEANGTMEVDTDASNKFIRKVVLMKKVDASLLAAVYSVPASGQNYVLEFNNASDRTKDDLRRVYLLDDSCNITSIAAANPSEKSNVTSTENWFCFNVLIKEVIFDAIADQL